VQQGSAGARADDNETAGIIMEDSS